MEKEVKIEIAKMLIPIIGTYYLLNRVIPGINTKLSWWDLSGKAIQTSIAIAAYQAIWWALLKYTNIILTT